MSGNQTKSERIACLEAVIAEQNQRITVLESTIERLDADRKTFVRHAQTTARNVRKLIAENRAFRSGVAKLLTEARNANDTFKRITTSAEAAQNIRDLIADPIRAVRAASSR